MASRISINGGPWQPLYSPSVDKADWYCHFCGGRCEVRFKHLVLCHKAQCKRRIYPTLKYLMKKDAERRRNLEKST